MSSRSLETFTSGTPDPTSALQAATAKEAESCADGSPGDDPWACLCSSMSAIPVSAALLDPVLDESGGITDFVIRAGNHVRSAEWLEAPDTQVGQRFLEARPGAATSGLLAALTSVFTSGRALNGLTVDYTEERHGRLRRAPLLYYAASC
ncbi:hypothetical protein [Streptomyces chryseus]|uniref:hypothetical protein n=1 Tax=Streptomyces chryseus TaxID=68186 RepID=UPI0019BEBD98|nr:hypothetical protein [Streptomyces chryseus]GGX14138.1 hypothetical protein GCM10010353_31720 [Streptomyces chryseus]